MRYRNLLPAAVAALVIAGCGDVPPPDVPFLGHGDGYLVDMNAWTPEIGRAMAEADGVDIDDVKWEQILKAREY